MTVPRVWAPRAAAVTLVLADDVRQPMRAVDGGWFEADDDLTAGTAYRFALDDGDPRPDPGSAWQPDGVHGPSVIVDHGAFGWTDEHWRPVSLAEAVLYEVHVGTFTTEGTYAAAVGRLDHLVALGVTHVELMPLATFAGTYGWGYDGVDLYAPHPAYGTPDDLRRFVDACHAKQLAVVLDVVYNHLGPEGNHLGEFGPYFTDRYHTPWGPAVNLDGPGSDEVRRFIIDNALHWFRHYHVDGLRLDAVHALRDGSATHILEQLATEVEALAGTVGRPLVLIAENDTNDPRLVHARADGGYGLDAHWCDDVHHALHTAITGESHAYYGDFDGRVSTVADALEHGYVYRGTYSACRERTVGRPPVGVWGRHLVAALQNHDQIGNRARGDRIAHLAGIERAKAAVTLLLLGPFVPLLFQGEEWAASSPFPYFADHDDPDLVEAVRHGRQAEFSAFGWDPADVLDPESDGTFELAKLDWDELDAGEHASTLQWYGNVIALRKSLAGQLDNRLAMTRDTHDSTPMLVEADDDAGTIVMRRPPLIVACNLSDRPASLTIDAAHVVNTNAVSWQLSSHPETAIDGTTLHLAPGAALVGLL